MTPVLPATWRKSTRSNGSDACVEVAHLSPVIGVRDSKLADAVITISPLAWTSFLADLTKGRLER